MLVLSKLKLTLSQGFMKKNAQDFLTIGEIAKRSGLNTSAIRFYESKELIFSIRTDGNQRRYSRHMLRRIALIKVAQKVGVSLQEIIEAFRDLPSHKAPSKEDWLNLSTVWQRALEEKIQALKRLQHQLDWCIGCGCLSLKACPLRNPDDELSDGGYTPISWAPLSDQQLKELESL